MFSKKFCFFEWKSNQNPDCNSQGVYGTLFEVNPYDLYVQSTVMELTPWEFLDNSAAVCSTDKILNGKNKKDEVQQN